MPGKNKPPSRQSNAAPKVDLQKIILENNILKRVMDDLIEGVYITDDQEVITWLNKSLEKTDGKKRENIIGLTETEAYGDIGRFHRHTTQTGQPVASRTAHYYLLDGRRADVVMSTKPYFEKGHLRAVYTIGFDMAQLRALVKMYMDLSDSGGVSGQSTLLPKTYCFSDIIGRSEALQKTVKIAKKAALAGANVLLCGETGTGKELFAQSIHNAGPQYMGPFMAINCSAIPETLLEGILFGTVKGAFTGAADNPGLFELAQDGSLFLDEINSMPMVLQAKLLRVIQQKEVRRLGAKKHRPINCRIISAANVDPMLAVRDNKLREDLYFRLAAITIDIPPLRDRIEDIPLLVDFFAKKNTKILKRPLVSQTVLNIFNSYAWPGNIRELENALEYAFTMKDHGDDLIDLKHLPPTIKAFGGGRIQMKDDNLPAQGDAEIQPALNLEEAIVALERKMIGQALAAHRGNLTQAAKSLGILRQTLTYKMRKLEINLSELLPEATIDY